MSANREQLPSLVVPIGVLSVAAAAREAAAGHEVEVLDLCFQDAPLDALAGAVARARPDVIGLGIRNLRDNGYAREAVAEYHAALGRTIRAATAAPLVLGGAAVTLQPGGLMELVGARHAVVGEGERAFPALLDALARGERPPPVLRAKPAPLDALPRPAEDLEDPRYRALEGTVPLQTKRGCQFHCAYCDYPDLEGRAVRTRAPAQVARDFARLAAAPDVAHVFVVDSVFNAPPAHARAICDALIAQGNRLPWSCYASPAGLDDALVAKMAAAGCAGVEIGTDAGTERGLRRLRKPFDLAAVRRVRASFRAHGLADCHSFVLGAEGETADEAREALAFVEELDPDVAIFLVFAEDREARVSAGCAEAEHRAALLSLLAREAPRRPGWVAPQLGVRFGAKVTRVVRQRGLRGPAWLHLAEARRASRG